MPTAVAHGLLAWMAGKLALRGRRANFIFWYTALVISILPDADVLLMRWIPYENPFGHRGFSHSLLFAFLAALVAMLICRKMVATFPGGRAGMLTFFLVLAVSHGVFDALTDGGLGIGFFAPFSNERFFFPWQPIPVSPLGRGFFSAEGATVLGIELLLFLPLAWGASLLATASKGRTKLLAAGLLALSGLAWLLRF